MNKIYSASYHISLPVALISFLYAIATGEAMPLAGYLIIIACFILELSFEIFVKHETLKTVLRTLACLLPALYWITLPQNGLVFLLGYSVVWGLGVLALSIKGRLTYRYFRSAFFSFTGLLLFAYIGISFAAGYISPVYTNRLLVGLDSVAPVLVIMLFSAILLLKSLRALEFSTESAEFEKRHLIEFLAFSALCAVVYFGKVIPMLTKALTYLWSNALGPIFARVFAFLFKDRTGDMRHTQPQAQIEPQPVDSNSDIRIVPTPEPVAGSFINDGAPEDSSSLVLALVIALAVIVIAAAVYYLLKLPMRRQAGCLKEVREHIPDDELQDGKGRRGRLSKSRPRDAIRLSYREHLMRLKRAGLVQERFDTAGSIHEKLAESCLGESEQSLELTQLYRKARYNLNEEPTQQDAKRARKLADGVRKQLSTFAGHGLLTKNK